MAQLVDDQFLERESRQLINDLKKESYICFQAAPEKAGASPLEYKEMLETVSDRYGLKIKLCPIGYASGHNDIDFLREIEELSNGEFPVLHDLNAWEIMSVIRYSKMFIGTSLHGVITALSFSVPHIGVNRNVLKLDKFLDDWGFEPSKRCYSVAEIPDIFESVINVDLTKLRAHSQHLIALGLRNNHRLVQALDLDK
jgi:hypothetical protein